MLRMIFVINLANGIMSVIGFIGIHNTKYHYTKIINITDAIMNVSRFFLLAGHIIHLFI